MRIMRVLMLGLLAAAWITAVGCSKTVAESTQKRAEEPGILTGETLRMEPEEGPLSATPPGIETKKGTPPGWQRSGKVPPGLAKKGVTMGMPWREAVEKAGKSVREVKIRDENGSILLDDEDGKPVVLDVKDGNIAGIKGKPQRPMTPPPPEGMKAPKAKK